MRKLLRSCGISFARRAVLFNKGSKNLGSGFRWHISLTSWFTEYVYFSVEEKLSLQKLRELSNAAWADGLSKVKPFYGHKNSDISLIVIVNSVEKAAAKEARKIKFHKSYKFSFFGWSNFSLIVYDVSAGKTWFNWHGRNLRSIFSKMPL